METELWEKVEELFSRAMQLPARERSVFVKGETPDARVVGEVLSLLEHADLSGEFLEPNDESRIGRALVDAARELEWANVHSVSKTAGSAELAVNGKQSTDRISTDEVAARLKHELAEKFPQYELESLLGSGGEAAVFAAHDRQLGRRVAIRVLLLPQSREQDRERVIGECRRLSRIQNEHVVTVYAVHLDGEFPLLVSELIDGPTLKQLLVEQGALRPRVAADIVRQTALGLTLAHKHSIVHCDVKPRNILLTPGIGYESGYLVKITDFGMAIDESDLSEFRKLLVGESTNVTTLAPNSSRLSGTLPYISPERLESGLPPNALTDVYGLGVTLYEALTGQLPYRGARHMIARQIREGHPVPPHRLDDRIPADLENIVLCAMACDPAARYQGVALLAEDLRRFLEGEPTQVRPASISRKLVTFARRNWQSLVFGSVLTILLLALAAGAILAITSNQNRQNQIRSIQGKLSEAMASELLLADHGMLQSAITKLADIDPSALEKIRKVSSDPTADSWQRLNADIIRLHLGEDTVKEIVRMLPEVAVRPELFQLLIAGQSDRVSLGHKVSELADVQTDPAFRSQIAWLAWATGDSRALLKICQDLKQPDLRTSAVMVLEKWHPEIENLVSRIREESDSMIRYVLFTGLGRIDPRLLHRVESRALLNLFRDFSGGDSLASDRNACQWAANQLRLIEMNEQLSMQRNGANWQRTDNGVMLVQIQPGTATLGVLDPRIARDTYLPHEVEFTSEFWISSSEISVELYRKFLNDRDYDSSMKPASFTDWTVDEEVSPSGSHPVNRVAWMDAVLFCNWLSVREGLQPCYRLASEADVDETSDKTTGPQFFAANVTFESSANGYRLPTEAEFEFAARAGCETNHWYGNNPDWMNELVSTSANVGIPARRCGELMPNPLGLHEMEGNVWEWCHDWYSAIGTERLVDPHGPDGPLAEFGARKICRGGGVNSLSGSAEVSARGDATRDTRWSNLGFRVVRKKVE